MKNFKIFMSIFLSTAFIATGTIAAPLTTVYADETSEAKDYSIGELFWDDTDNRIIASWDEAEDKTGYKVKLFKGNKGISTYFSVNKPKYDFTSLIIEKGTGTYTFYVYSTKLGRDTQKASPALVVDSDLLSDLKNARKRSDNSNNSGPSADYSGAKTGRAGGPGTANIFQNPNYSDVSGVSTANKGWVFANKHWYFVDDNHTLASTSWRHVNDQWYFFDDKCVMRTGWIEWKGLWYFLDPNTGAMWYNATTPDNYYVNADGVWVK